MKPYRLKVKIIILLSGIISIVVFALILLLWHRAESDKVGEILLHYGLIMLPITMLWWLLEKHCWHLKYAQKFRSSLNIPPDFRGRWEGILNRDGEDNPHKFVIEIKQTLSKVWVCSYSSRSVSRSYIAEITSDDSEENFTLCFLWQSDAGPIVQRKIPKSIFYGYSFLQLFDNENPKKLSGKYFTNRDPQTKGVHELVWVSYDLKNKF